MKFELDFNNFIKQSSLLCVLLLFFLCKMCFLLSSFLFRCVPFLVSNTTSHVFVGVVVKIIPLIRTR